MIGRVNVGGGGRGIAEAFAYIHVTYTAGAVCTATNGSVTIAAPNTSGSVVFAIPEPSSLPETWTIMVTDGVANKTTQVSITAQYQFEDIVLLLSRLPLGYQEVEYIEATYSSASQFPYIDTGVVFNSTSEIDITFMILSANVCVCGSQQSNTDSGQTIVECPILATGTGLYRLGDDTYSASTVLNEKRNVILSRSRCIEDDIPLTAVQTGKFRVGAMPLYLFAKNMYGTQYQYSSASSRIYSYTLTDTSNNTITQQLIPCYRISDNAAGMIDLVSENFFANAGTGTFVVGPDV